MRINIETIPHQQQRYNTVGDYFFDADGVLQIRVSEMGSRLSELLVIIHELSEQAMTEAAGITNEEIDEFDMGHPELADPGADKRAPYHIQHTVATAVEMIVCAEMGISWADHCETVDAL